MQFNIYSNPVDLDSEEANHEYVDNLMQLFIASEEGKLLEDGQFFWIESFISYGLTYLGAIPPDVDEPDLEELLFDLFPRKISSDPESDPDCVPSLITFWQFLKREYQLANAGMVLEFLQGEGDDFILKMKDSSNWGMAKSMVMGVERAGLDPSSEEDIDKYMAMHNENLMGLSLSPTPFDEQSPPQKEQSQLNRAKKLKQKKKQKKKMTKAARPKKKKKK